jgi:ATP-binding cassette, subfamily B, bacterial
MKRKSSLGVLKFALTVSRPLHPFLWGFFIVATLLSMDTIFRPYLLKFILDQGQNVTLEARKYGVLEASNGLYKTFIESVMVLIVLQFVSPILWRIFDWCLLKYDPNLKNAIVKKAFDRCLSYPYRFFHNEMTGGLAARVRDLSVSITHISVNLIIIYYRTILTMVIALGVLYQVNVCFALGMVIWMMAVGLFLSRTGKKMSTLSSTLSNTISNILGQIVDSFSNFLSVFLFHNKDHEFKRLEAEQKHYLQAASKRLRFIVYSYGLQGFSFALYQGVCLGLLVFFIGHNQVTPGDFAMILMLNSRIMDDLWRMIEETKNLTEHWGAAQQALDTIYNDDYQVVPDTGLDLNIHEGSITLDKVCFSYHPQNPLFQDQSLHIPGGQKVGLVGYSGSGKSTFINLLLRLYDVQKGSIAIDGQNITDLSLKSLRNTIGVIPQDPSLFHRSIKENISYSKPESSDEEIFEAARLAHCDEFIQKLPQGYDTCVGERGMQLSGGQRQRIAIARLFLKNPPILILDEATSQLDSLTEAHIQRALWDLMNQKVDGVLEKKTTLVIAHRLSTLLSMDRILVFDKGRIVQDGSHKKLLETPGLYRQLWASQSEGLLPLHPLDNGLASHQSPRDSGDLQDLESLSKDTAHQGLSKKTKSSMAEEAVDEKTSLIKKDMPFL